MAPDGRTVSFLVGKKRYTCGVAGAACSAADVPETDPRNGAARMVQVASPDGKLAVFIRTDNLWLRDLQSGTERVLTTDGVKDFGYATDNAGWT
jgi:hypothetical protein